MTEREAFIAAIAASPDEDTPRLAFADWLQENGEDDRAAFVRLACEIAVLRRELGYPSEPGSDELRRPWEQANKLLERCWREWLAPFLGALGCEETGPPPERGWAGRLWERVTGGPRVTNFRLDNTLGDSANLEDWGNGPVRTFGFNRGLVEHLEINFESPFPVTDLAAAFRREPVRSLAFHFRPNAPLWDRLDVPVLSRVSRLNLELPPTYSGRAATAFTDLAFGGNWSGLRDLHAWCPQAPEFAIPRGYVRQLADAPLLSGLDALGVNVALADLSLITASPHARGLRRFRLWGRLPAAAAEALCDATFRPNLEDLDLSMNDLGDDGVRRLAAGSWPKLRKLDLGASYLTDACVPHLLPLASQLTDLSLAGGQITGTGARLLADALDPDTLESFCLSYNPLSEPVAAELRERFGDRFQYRARDDSDRFDDLLEFPIEPT